MEAAGHAGGAASACVTGEADRTESADFVSATDGGCWAVGIRRSAKPIRITQLRPLATVALA
jgi:hypothetical protein